MTTPAPVRLSLRLLFGGVFLTALIFGAWLYLAPGASAGVWPYPMKPLATRFFASVFLAVAVGSFFALRERMRPNVQVLLVLGVSVFGFILLAALLNLPTLELDSPGAALWLAVFVAVPVGSALFLLVDRESRPAREASPPASTIPPGLRLSFFLHTAVVLVFATPMLLRPDISVDYWPWAVTLPIMQGIGGLFLGVAVGTGWAFRQRAWERIQILLPVNVTFVAFVLIAVAFQWDVIAAESPSAAVTLGWLLLYFYTGGYALFYWLRDVMRSRSPPASQGAA